MLRVCNKYHKLNAETKYDSHRLKRLTTYTKLQLENVIPYASMQTAATGESELKRPRVRNCVYFLGGTLALDIIALFAYKLRHSLYRSMIIVPSILEWQFAVVYIREIIGWSKKC